MNIVARMSEDILWKRSW